MLSKPKQDDRLGRLADRLQVAPTLSVDLVWDIVGEACTRVAALRRAGKTARISRLIEAGAWTDVAFALIALELPFWTLRRLLCEEGEWLCSLSRQPNLPMELDETADGRHRVLPLAILSALVEARRRPSAEGDFSSVMPQVRPTLEFRVCCDNFR